MSNIKTELPRYINVILNKIQGVVPNQVIYRILDTKGNTYCINHRVNEEYKLLAYDSNATTFIDTTLLDSLNDLYHNLGDTIYKEIKKSIYDDMEVETVIYYDKTITKTVSINNCPKIFLSKNPYSDSYMVLITGKIGEVYSILTKDIKF